MSKWTELQDKPVDWKIYNSGDEQIAEISSSKNGFVCRNNETDSGILTIKYGQLFSDQSEYPILNAMWSGSLKRFVETNNTTHYWIIPDDPLREMKVRQAQTGQPVWIRTNPFDWDVSVPSHYETTTPDWNIPNAEYSFIEFEKSVDK